MFMKYSSNTKPPDKARHDKLVSLVERMLELHKRSPRLPQEKESLQREIEPAADGMIDKLVYELSRKGMIWIDRRRDKDSGIVREAFRLPLNQQGEAS